MATYKRGLLTIKNFGDNKSAAIKYFNNIKNKDYVEYCGCGFSVEDNGYCVDISYKKNK